MPVPDSLTIDELKRRVDLQLSGDDDLLEDYLEAAFQQAQAPFPYGCGRTLLPDPELVDGEPVEKRFVVRGSRFVRVPDARVITQVLADGVEIAADDYEVLERNEHIVRLELLRARPRVVTVIGRFGFTTIPGNLADAIYILAARSYYERNAQYADQVAIAEGAAVQSYFRQLPPRTKLVFASYAVPEARLA